MKNLDKIKSRIPEAVFSEIPAVMEKFEINTPLRLAHFLSQCAHESADFKIFKENLNYSKEGLLKIFPKYFTSVLAETYARKPEKIASRVYANRMGNGDENSKEGFKFFGRGSIQLTGKENYISFGKAIGEDLISNPDLVSEKYALQSAAWFFSKNGLNKIADKGDTNQVVTEVTKRVNGGVHGLDDRLKKFKIFYDLLK